MEDLVLDTTYDEFGNKRWGWWCNDCEEGEFVPSEQERNEQAERHVARLHGGK